MLGTLMPVLVVEGKDCAMLAPQLAGSARKELGVEVADFAGQQEAIMAALDFLIASI